MSTTFERIGFIGAGRLGTAMAWALSRRGAPIVAVASRSQASAERLASGIAGCAVLPAQSVVDAADLVFITTPDGQIASTTASLAWRAGVGVAHCSGATELAALDAAARQGALIGGLHPMQTFADTEAAIASLAGCTMAIEAAEPLRARLEALVSLLGGRLIHLTPGSRVLYHAAGAYASQYINVLLKEAAKLWATFGASEADALHAMLPLVRGTLAAIEAAGITKAMPGPISRGDTATIERHVAGIGALDPNVQRLYCELALRCVPMAIERGALDDDKAARLERVLHEARRSAG